MSLCKNCLNKWTLVDSDLETNFPWIHCHHSESKTINREKKISAFDIDGTICETKWLGDKWDYENCKPYMDRIAYINSLYDAGYKIIYWTARGTVTGIDWESLTRKQLDSWGCKYHELLMKKPIFDILVDDKAREAEPFFRSVIPVTVEF